MFQQFGYTKQIIVCTVQLPPQTPWKWTNSHSACSNSHANTGLKCIGTLRTNGNFISLCCHLLRKLPNLMSFKPTLASNTLYGGKQVASKDGRNFCSNWTALWSYQAIYSHPRLGCTDKFSTCPIGFSFLDSKELPIYIPVNHVLIKQILLFFWVTLQKYNMNNCSCPNP